MQNSNMYGMRLWGRADEEADVEEITEGNPLHVKTVNPTQKVQLCGPVLIPGIGTGVAYAANDAVGTIFAIPVPKSGTIVGARFYDPDHEGLAMKLYLFNKSVTGAADNAAFSVADDPTNSLEAVIGFSTFHDLGANFVATEDGLNISYLAPLGVLYCLMQTLGAPNIAANAIPSVSLRIVAD